MHCFYCTDTPAVGICKSCNKGLCGDCATDLGHGLACKNSHEEQAEAINMMIERGTKAYAAAPAAAMLSPLFIFSMGLLFTFFGFSLSGAARIFPLLIGGGFIFFAILMFIRNRAMFPKDK